MRFRNSRFERLTHKAPGLAGGYLLLLLLVLSLGGMQDYYQDRELRWSLMAIFLVGLVASSAVLYLPMVGSDSSMDERDLLIMTKGSQIQSVTIALWLVFWAIWTTETYWEQGAIPIAFPILIAMSSIIVNLAGLSLGILICYRTMARHG